MHSRNAITTLPGKVSQSAARGGFALLYKSFYKAIDGTDTKTWDKGHLFILKHVVPVNNNNLLVDSHIAFHAATSKTRSSS